MYRRQVLKIICDGSGCESERVFGIPTYGMAVAKAVARVNGWHFPPEGDFCPTCCESRSFE